VGFSSNLVINSASAHAPAAGDVSYIAQGIEGTIFKRALFGSASAKNLMLSFWVYASNTGTYSFVLKNAGSTRSYVATFTVINPTTWERKVISITGCTDGTWATDKTQAALLAFDLGSGSTFKTGSTNSWQAANYIGATGQNDLVNTTGKNVQITGVRLRIGTVDVPDYEFPFQVDTLLCQRYYEKSYDYGTAAGTVTNAGAIAQYVGVNMTAGGTQVRFKVHKRSTPTVTVYSPNSGTSAKIYDYANLADQAATVDFVGERGARVYWSQASNSLNGGIHFVADADF